MPRIVSIREYCEREDLPELLQEYAEDNTLPADRVGYTSHIDVVWKCKHGHIETESPYKRFRRGYCKTCGKEQNGSFAQRYPALVPYWSEDNEVSPQSVSPRYSKPVKWKCPEGHEWERTIAKQIAAASPCPYCREEKNALFHVRPELLAEWDAEANGNIDPDSVSFMSNVRYHWVCPSGHRFEASPAERIRRNKGCPICKSFGAKYPDAASEWNTLKNDFSPYDVSPFSNKSAWFICKNCKSDYLSVIKERARRKGPYCPHCPR